MITDLEQYNHIFGTSAFDSVIDQINSKGDLVG